jgi:group II intron reverse transcriptase/maturase
MRPLGIPTVIDRVIQQAIAEQLTPIFEPIFSEKSYGYRPGKSAQMAIQKVKEYAKQGYGYAVMIDLSKYFDTLNHELLMNMVREQVPDKRVTDLIKKYLKSGVLENGLLVKTDEGSPQGGPLSPILANLFMHYAFDSWMARNHKKNPFERYADDTVVHCRTEQEAKQLLGRIDERLNFPTRGIVMHLEKSI